MSPDMDILLATCARFADLTDEDQALARALRAEGASVRPAVWDDPRVDWRSASMVVVRSVWDYHLRLHAFLAWADRVGAATRLHNPAALIRWNAHKSYLRELARSGVPVVETE